MEQPEHRVLNVTALLLKNMVTKLMFANQAGDSGHMTFKVKKFYSESTYKAYYFLLYVLLKISFINA